MKKTISILTVCAMVFMTMIYGCKKDTTSNAPVTTIKYCDTAHCGATATCDSATRSCKCDAGYEGAGCMTVTVSKYYGTWIENGTATNVPVTNVTATVSANTASALNMNVSFTFNGVSYTYVRVLASTGTNFTIPALLQSDGATLSGSGAYNTPTTVIEALTLAYPANGSSAAFTVTVVLTGVKQ
jgi:hypothetical protein